MSPAWTLPLDRELDDCRAAGMKFKDIGVKTGRSTASVLSRWHIIKGKVDHVDTITHSDLRSAENVQAKLYDLLLAVQQCQTGGRGVMITIGLEQTSLVVWKDRYGSIATYDESTMKLVLGVTIP